MGGGSRRVGYQKDPEDREPARLVVFGRGWEGGGCLAIVGHFLVVPGVSTWMESRRLFFSGEAKSPQKFYPNAIGRDIGRIAVPA